MTLTINRMTVTKGANGLPHFEIFKDKRNAVDRSDVKIALFYEKSIKIDNYKFNKGSIIDYINSKNGNKKLKKGFFGFFGGSSDSKVRAAFAQLFIQEPKADSVESLRDLKKTENQSKSLSEEESLEDLNKTEVQSESQNVEEILEDLNKLEDQSENQIVEQKNLERVYSRFKDVPVPKLQEMKERVGRIRGLIEDIELQKRYNNSDVEKQGIFFLDDVKLSRIHIEAALRYMILSNHELSCIFLEENDLFTVCFNESALNDLLSTSKPKIRWITFTTMQIEYDIMQK